MVLSSLLTNVRGEFDQFSVEWVLVFFEALFAALQVAKGTYPGTLPMPFSGHHVGNRAGIDRRKSSSYTRRKAKAKGSFSFSFLRSPIPPGRRSNSLKTLDFERERRAGDTLKGLTPSNVVHVFEHPRALGPESFMSADLDRDG